MNVIPCLGTCSRKEPSVSSIEAVEALKESEQAWQRYVKRHSKISSEPINLRSANLRGAVLAGRVFDNCDLSLTRFDGADLDRTSFRYSKLDAVVFAEASLVEASFSSVDFTSTVLSGVVIREAKFLKCHFTGCDFDNSTIEDVQFISCELRGCSGSDSRIERTRFHDCEIHDWEIRSASGQTGGAIISDCEFLHCNIVHADVHNHLLLDSLYHRCVLTQTNFNACHLTRVKFISCNLDHLAVVASTITELDLSRSTVVLSDLNGMGLGTAVLLGTAFVQCHWPEQRGRVTWLGRYVPSPTLISHPVQDVRSVVPTLRREIADAQYLVARLRMVRGAPSRLLFRLWGFTSAYGQSVARLFVMSCGVIFLHGLVISTLQTEFTCVSANCSAYARSLAEAVVLSARAFVGLSQDSSTAEFSRDVENVIISARVWGFFALGVWISVAANKLSKLSAE